MLKDVGIALICIVEAGSVDQDYIFTFKFDAATEMSWVPAEWCQLLASSNAEFVRSYKR